MAISNEEILERVKKLEAENQLLKKRIEVQSGYKPETLSEEREENLLKKLEHRTGRRDFLKMLVGAGIVGGAAVAPSAATTITDQGIDTQKLLSDIDANGHSITGLKSVTTDQITVSKVYVEMYLSGAQSVAGDDKWDDIDFDALEHDDFDGYDADAKEYVIQEAGVYIMTGKVEANVGQNNYLACRAKVNDTVICRHYTHGSADAIISSSVSSMDYLNKGDIINTQVKQNSGGSVSLETGKMATYAHLAKVG